MSKKTSNRTLDRRCKVATSLWKKCYKYSDVAAQMSLSSPTVRRLVIRGLKEQGTTPAQYAEKHMNKKRFATWQAAVNRGYSARKKRKAPKATAQQGTTQVLIGALQDMLEHSGNGADISLLVRGASRYARTSIKNKEIRDAMECVRDEFNRGTLSSIKIHGAIDIAEEAAT